MSQTYEEYDRDYNAALAKIRSFLAGNRSRETLTQCQTLLEEAKQHATAMQGMAEIEGNPVRVTESKQRIQRDIGPLSKEVKRQLDGMVRQDLFQNNNAGYEAPQSDMQGLLSNSENMLRDSLALCADSEEVGTSTLLQMGRQREQLETTAGHIDATRSAAEQAGTILRSMSSKAFRNKVFLKGAIAFLALMNLWALVHVFRRKNK